MNNNFEQIDVLLNHLHAGNEVEAENVFNALMQEKVDAILNAGKQEVAASMFNTEDCGECEETNEALKGGQHKIDANKNGKIDAQDFKMLRAKKGMKEETDTLQEAGDVARQNKAAKDAWQERIGMKHPNETTPPSGGARGAKENARLRGRAVLKRMRNEEVEQVDELSPSLKRQVVKSMHGSKPGNTDSVKTKTWRKRVQALNLTPDEQIPSRKQLAKIERNKMQKEAYADPYAAKKAAEMKKKKEEQMAAAKKEYEASQESKGKVNTKNFMKMKEEIEQVDEISKTKLANYVRAAARDAGNEAYASGQKHGKGEHSPTYSPREIKRTKGIRTALDKLANEEVESVEESKYSLPPGSMKPAKPVKKGSYLEKRFGHLKPGESASLKGDPKKVKKANEEVESVDEASYSAKMARAGKDIGKPGKMFKKIAAKASRKYGKDRGAKIAGAVLAKLRSKKGK
jgi:hypothetical protein